MLSVNVLSVVMLIAFKPIVILLSVVPLLELFLSIFFSF